MPTAEDYEWGDLLGEGAYGEVRVATHKETGKTYAIKTLDKRQIVKEKKAHAVNREKDILNALKHTNIVFLFCTFQDTTSLCNHNSVLLSIDTYIDFVLELCPYGELLDLIKKVHSES